MLTVVIPTYNRPDYLRKNLSALSNQTQKEFVVIVVDDQSEKIEQVRAVIAEFKTKLTLTLIEKDVKDGAQGSRNRGLKSATSDFVAFIDDDDYYKDDAVEKICHAILEKPDSSLLYAQADVVDDKGNVIGLIGSQDIKNFKNDILYNCYIPSPTVVLNRSLALSIGGFDMTFPSCQDWEMWIRTIHTNDKVVCIPGKISNYRKHEGPTIGKSKKAEMGYKLLYRKHYKRFVKLAFKTGDFLYLARITKNLI